MCGRMYVCIYVCVRTFVYVYDDCIYVSMYGYVRVCTCVSMYVYVRVCTYVCVRTCGYVVWVRMCVCMYVCVRVCTYVYVCMYLCMCTYVCVRTYGCVCVYVHQLRSYVRMHVDVADVFIRYGVYEEYLDEYNVYHLRASLHSRPLYTILI